MHSSHLACGAEWLQRRTPLCRVFSLAEKGRLMQTRRQGREAADPQPLSVPSLAGLSARLRVDVAGQPTRMLEIHDGTFSIRPTAGAESWTVR